MTNLAVDTRGETDNRRPRWPADFERRGEHWVHAGYSSIAYSDGDAVENAMLRAIEGTTDRSVFSLEVQALMNGWAMTYHFSALRSNPVRPIAFRKGARVLEVGAGCGAVTRYLGELGLSVTAVEGSERRAMIAAARTADLDNVTVIAGKVGEIEFDQPFDYVIAVGVLEYAATFGVGEEPYRHFLDSLREFLLPDGLVLLAIENRLGLKYLGGMPEDHVGQAFVGVNSGYRLGGPRTFSTRELLAHFAASGLPAARVLSPFPDYKLVTSVIDFAGVPEQATESMAQLAASAFHQDLQVLGRTPTLSLEMAMAGAVVEGIGQQLSNSFLVIAGESANAVDAATTPGEFAWAYAASRPASSRKATTLADVGDAVRAINTPLDGSTGEASTFGATRHALQDEQFRTGRSCWLAMGEAVNQIGWMPETVADALRPWFDALVAVVEADGSEATRRLVDATPFNAAQAVDGTVEFYDLEWQSVDPPLLEYVVLRSITIALNRFTSVARPGFEGTVPQIIVAQAIMAELLPDGHPGHELDMRAYITWLTEFTAGSAEIGSLSVERTADQLAKHLFLVRP